jgi:3-hydroxyacyl-CoA dehydrogenase/enoyl-CoA hydratase/3-hydroxybutyryl-CoA epimerase
LSSIRYERDADGIVVLTLDDPYASVNTMNDGYVASMSDVLDRLAGELDLVTGIVVTSAKKTFFAGADLKRLVEVTAADAPAVFERIELVNAQLRRLETIGRPVVAAINGSALGSGLGIALACHRRIAVDDARSGIGFPEVTLGLIPGAGGITRTVRMLGLQDALTNVLIRGRVMKPARALVAGLVDALVNTTDDLVVVARRWILDSRGDAAAAVQPWDRPGYRLTGGAPGSRQLTELLPALPPMLRRQLKGAPYPAPRAIVSAAVEGAQVDFDTATRIEARFLTGLVTGQVFKNMTQAFFFDLNHINAGGSRPPDVPRFAAARVAVVGAGMMGAGIAHCFARAGVDVRLKDISAGAAERGKAQARRLLDQQVTRGRLSPADRDRTLNRITPTARTTDLAGCDVVIEAVFESSELKRSVFAEIEDVVAPGALLCTNTSTLPITGLATAVRRPVDFIGLHFFSPADRMPLVEIIEGAETSPEAVAKAYDIVRQIEKTPIVVNDSRGFFTSRVFGMLVMEGAAMVGEGVPPATVEHAATMAGFPAPPLAMIDEVSLRLPLEIQAEADRDRSRPDDSEPGGPATFGNRAGLAVVRRMVEEFGRPGKSSGAGFYDYPPGGSKRLWPGLREHFGPWPAAVDVAELQDRMTFVMSVETIRCVEEGVLTSTPDANIGSILGIGFPARYGGALQFANQYAGGLAGFARRAQELADRYGPRFAPPALLAAKAADGERF